jgi:phosphate:Na+ symporter
VSIMRFLELAGGLGLFLYGMHVLSDSVQRRAGKRMRHVLNIFTANRFAGVTTGLLVTTVIQSSSATTVLLVSIVNAGLMTLEQAIGVVMGANIGTTMTAWIVSLLGFQFKITAMALPAIAFGIPLFFSRREKHREIAGILIGFGILFLGLSVMKDSVPDIHGNPQVMAFVARFSGESILNVILFVVIGTVLTICVQSSSAAMAITITMAFKGWINFPAAAAIVLGENIGTTITAYLASLGMNVEAKRTACAHMLFNLIGVAWILAVFFPFLRAIDALVPGDCTDPHVLPFHLSAFHSVFNVANTALLVGFVPLLARLVRHMVPERAVIGRPHLALVTTQTAEDVDANLISAQAELGRMSGIVNDMALWVMNALQQDETLFHATRAKVAANENATDEIRDNINQFLTDCMTATLSEEQANRIRAMYRVAQELESIGDRCRNIMRRLNKRAKSQAAFHEAGVQDLAEYVGYVLDFLRYNHDSLTGKTAMDTLDTAKAMEKNLNHGRNRLRKMVHATLAGGADVRGELIFLDIVRLLEQIGDHSYNIARELPSMHGETPPT